MCPSGARVGPAQPCQPQVGPGQMVLRPRCPGPRGLGQSARGHCLSAIWSAQLATMESIEQHLCVCNLVTCGIARGHNGRDPLHYLLVVFWSAGLTDNVVWSLCGDVCCLSLHGPELACILLSVSFSFLSLSVVLSFSLSLFLSLCIHTFY